MPLTLTELKAISSVLADNEEAKKLIAAAIAEDRKARAEEAKAEAKRMEYENFYSRMALVQKLVDPLDILVTRPRVTCWHLGRDTEYEIRFWKKRYGHVNLHGNVSEGGGGCLLAELYTTKVQDRNPEFPLHYPNHERDMSYLFPDHQFVRRTEEFNFGREWTYGPERIVEVDMFTLVERKPGS